MDQFFNTWANLPGTGGAMWGRGFIHPDSPHIKLHQQLAAQVHCPDRKTAVSTVRPESTKPP